VFGLKLHNYLLKDCDLDSNSHVISFINDSNLAMSIKPLTSMITANIQICVYGVAEVAELEKEVVMYRYETASQSFQPHSVTNVQIITKVLG